MQINLCERKRERKNQKDYKILDTEKIEKYLFNKITKKNTHTKLDKKNYLLYLNL